MAESSVVMTSSVTNNYMITSLPMVSSERPGETAEGLGARRALDTTLAETARQLDATDSVFDDVTGQATTRHPFEHHRVRRARPDHHHGAVAHVEARQLDDRRSTTELAFDRPVSVGAPAVLARAQADLRPVVVAHPGAQAIE
jgi:hypothetical protein